MAAGMDMPKINIVDDPQLNAFASGIDRKSYTVTVTTGLLRLLDDEELAGVLGHELTHIRNHDTKLFENYQRKHQQQQQGHPVVATDLGLHSFLLSGRAPSGIAVVLVLIIGYVLCAIAYLFTALTRFAISRKREYMADAGGAELCGNPLALASALRKISGDPGLQGVKRDDVAQLFIIHPQKLSAGGAMSMLSSLFSTHPDTKKRIEILEQF